MRQTRILKMKTQLLMLAMATSTFAQTRNGTQDGGNSTGEANSQKDLPRPPAERGSTRSGSTGGTARSNRCRIQNKNRGDSHYHLSGITELRAAVAACSVTTYRSVIAISPVPRWVMMVQPFDRAKVPMVGLISSLKCCCATGPARTEAQSHDRRAAPKCERECPRN